LVDIIELLNNIATDIANAIPAVIAAIIIILIGYAIGILVGKAVNKIVEKLGMEKSFDQTITGKSFRSAGLDLSNFIGAVTKAFIIILSIILAIQVLNVGGTFGTYLGTIADYLPRLLGGILIIVFGTVFVDFLATFIGKMLRPMFPEAKVEIADMLKNLLLIGLIAFIILLALDTMLLSGDTIYPLILGFVIIGAGIALTDTLIKSITDDHSEFKTVAGYAKFVLYSIFLIIGAGAIFATFPGVTEVIANISWAFAIALAIMLIPVGYAIAKKISKETT
jgi:Mechanosensitive ion channel, conserved TM helix